MSIRRRDLITLLGGAAAAWPPAARGQQPDRMRRIGVLMVLDENDPVAKTYVSAFTRALAGLGWADGRNVRMDLRWGAMPSIGYERSRRSWSACCARAVTSHAAALPSPAMNSRRRIGDLPRCFTPV